MRKLAFTMRLKPGFAQEYKRRHDEIWPDLSALLTKVGIRDYSIYLDEPSGILFAVQYQTADSTADQLPAQEIMRRWWAHMGDIMETNPDGSPQVTPLMPVFHMD